jgi:hypothetical protein
MEQDNVRQPAASSVPAKVNVLAIVSLILGVLGFFCLGFTSVFGLVLGMVALGQIRKSEGRSTGKLLALGGLATSVLSILFGGLIVLLICLMPKGVEDEVIEIVKQEYPDLKRERNDELITLEAYDKTREGTVRVFINTEKKVVIFVKTGAASDNAFPLYNKLNDYFGGKAKQALLYGGLEPYWDFADRKPGHDRPSKSVTKLAFVTAKNDGSDVFKKAKMIQAAAAKYYPNAEVFCHADNSPIYSIGNTNAPNGSPVLAEQSYAVELRVRQGQVEFSFYVDFFADTRAKEKLYGCPAHTIANLPLKKDIDAIMGGAGVAKEDGGFRGNLVEWKW